MNKRLYRSTKEKMIGGVCGGIGEYFDIDPVLIRILFVVTLFVWGTGILAYIICWIIIPERPYTVPVTQPADSSQPSPPPPQPPTPTSGDHRGSMVAGVILIIIGGLFLADNFLPHFRFGDFWPIILIALGIGILTRSSRQA